MQNAAFLFTDICRLNKMFYLCVVRKNVNKIVYTTIQRNMKNKSTDRRTV